MSLEPSRVVEPWASVPGCGLGVGMGFLAGHDRQRVPAGAPAGTTSVSATQAAAVRDPPVRSARHTTSQCRRAAIGSLREREVTEPGSFRPPRFPPHRWVFARFAPAWTEGGAASLSKCPVEVTLHSRGRRWLRWAARLAVIFGVFLYWFGSSIVAPVEESWSDVPELVAVAPLVSHRQLLVEGDRCPRGRVDVVVQDLMGRTVAATSALPRGDGGWTAFPAIEWPMDENVYTVHATCQARVARDYSVGTVRLP